MAVRVRFPLRVLQTEFVLKRTLFRSRRVTQSVGGGVAELSALGVSER